VLEESHRGHLKFWFSDGGVVVVVVVVAVVVVVVLDVRVTLLVAVEGREEGDGVDCSRTPPPPPPPLMDGFLSPAMRLAPANSSWIIFFILVDLQQSKNEKQKGGEAF